MIHKFFKPTSRSHERHHNKIAANEDRHNCDMKGTRMCFGDETDHDDDVENENEQSESSQITKSRSGGGIYVAILLGGVVVEYRFLK